MNSDEFKVLHKVADHLGDVLRALDDLEACDPGEDAMWQCRQIRQSLQGILHELRAFSS